MNDGEKSVVFNLPHRLDCVLKYVFVGYRDRIDRCLMTLFPADLHSCFYFPWSLNGVKLFFPVESLEETDKSNEEFPRSKRLGRSVIF